MSKTAAMKRLQTKCSTCPKYAAGCIAAQKLEAIVKMTAKD